MTLPIAELSDDAAPEGPDRSSILANLTAMLSTAGLLVVVLTVLCGVVYPLTILAASQLLFPDQATGSQIVRGGRIIGSRLIGQSFTAPDYFWARPSATAPDPYNAAASGGSNLGPDNPALGEAVRVRIAALRALDPQAPQPVPIDLVTASGSGLDPDISVAAARYQIGRVARLRHAPVDALDRLVDGQIIARQLGVLGEPRINVLALNLALDRAFPQRRAGK